MFGMSDPRWEFRVLRKGGGGGGTTTTQNYSPEEAARRAQVMDEARRVYGQSTPMGAYTGPKPVGPSAETQMAQNYVTHVAAPQAAMGVQDINQAVQFGLADVLNPATNPGLQGAITAAQRPVMQQFTDAGGVLSQIRDAAGGAGQFGGTRQGIAEGIASGRLSQTLGDISSSMVNENYQKGLDTFSKTLAFAPEAMKTNLLPAQMLEAAGLQKEDYAQEQENYLAAMRDWEMNKQWAPLQNYANIVYGGGSSQSTTTVPGQKTNRLGGALGGAATGMAIGGPWGAAAGALLGMLV